MLAKSPLPNFMKLRSAVLELLRSDRQTGRHGEANRRTLQLLAAKMPKNEDACLLGCSAV
jgi:hypothetical protein